LGLDSICSALAWVTPSSSASTSAKKVHLTMSSHWSSPWRTAGANGSLLMMSGKTTWSSGRCSAPRMPASWLASVLKASQRPAM
jgi:hypothetical protein